MIIKQAKNLLKRAFSQKKALLFFLLVLLCFVVSLPVSGLGLNYVTTDSPGNDQAKFRLAVEQVIKDGKSYYVNSGDVGVGYVALGVIFTRLFAGNIPFALIILNRLSLAITALLFLIASDSIITRGAKNTFLWRMIAFIYTLIVILRVDFVSFSDIPWTHFVASMFLTGVLTALNYIAANSKSQQSLSFWICFLGLCIAGLIQTRFFEGLILCLSLVATLIVTNFRRKDNIQKKVILKYLSIGGISFLCGGFFLGLIGGNLNLKFQYFDLSKSNAYVAEYTKFYFFDAPIKIVQMFWDSNFFTYNQSFAVTPLFNSSQEQIWRMPVLMQAPILIYALPVSITFGVGRFLRKSLFNSHHFSFLVAFIYGIGTILGYSSAAAAGSPQLKYGYIRDFMSAVWALSLAAGPWVFMGIINKLSKNRSLLFNGWLSIAALIIPITGLILWEAIIRIAPKNSFSELHISQYQTEAKCSNAECDIKITPLNKSGRIVRYPLQDGYIAQFTCNKTFVNYATTLKTDGISPSRLVLPPCNTDLRVQLQPVIGGLASTLESPIQFSISQIIEANLNQESYQGHIDILDCASIQGWGWDPSHPFNAITATISVEGEVKAKISAKDLRNDLKLAGIGNGEHSFNYSWSETDLPRGNISVSFGETLFYTTTSPLNCQLP